MLGIESTIHQEEEQQNHTIEQQLKEEREAELRAEQRLIDAEENREEIDRERFLDQSPQDIRSAWAQLGELYPSGETLFAQCASALDTLNETIIDGDIQEALELDHAGTDQLGELRGAMGELLEALNDLREDPPKSLTDERIDMRDRLIQLEGLMESALAALSAEFGGASLEAIEAGEISTDTQSTSDTGKVRDGQARAQGVRKLKEQLSQLA